MSSSNDKYYNFLTCSEDRVWEWKYMFIRKTGVKVDLLDEQGGSKNVWSRVVDGTVDPFTFLEVGIPRDASLSDLVERFFNKNGVGITFLLPDGSIAPWDICFDSLRNQYGAGEDHSMNKVRRNLYMDLFREVEEEATSHYQILELQERVVSTFPHDTDYLYALWEKVSEAFKKEDDLLSWECRAAMLARCGVEYFANELDRELRDAPAEALIRGFRDGLCSRPEPFPIGQRSWQGLLTDTEKEALYRIGDHMYQKADRLEDVLELALCYAAKDNGTIIHLVQREYILSAGEIALQILEEDGSDKEPTIEVDPEKLHDLRLMFEEHGEPRRIKRLDRVMASRPDLYDEPF